MASSAMGLFPEIKVATITKQWTIAAGATDSYDFPGIPISAAVIGVKIDANSHWFTWSFADFTTYQLIKIKNEGSTAKTINSVTVYYIE